MPVELIWDGKYTDDEKKFRKSPQIAVDELPPALAGG